MSPFHTIPIRSLRFPLVVFFLLAAFISTCSLYALNTHAAQVTLQWDPNTEPDLLGYKVYYGSSSRSYQFNNDVGNKTTCTVSNLEDGKAYYFAVTAYDASGNESNYSGEVVFNSPPSCTYSISPSSQSFSSSGGTGAVSVTAQAGCTWTATANQSWLLITSNSGGSGNGTVNYSVSANPNSSSRTGTLTIAGKTFTVTQAGLVQCTLTVTKTGTGTGTVATNPLGTTFNAGTVVTLAATADANSTFTGWSGRCTGTSPSCTVTMNANTTVTATFALTLQTFTITASAGTNGSISPQGAVSVNPGASQTFTITPGTGYQIADVKADGISVGVVGAYTFGNVRANHAIEAIFSPVPSNNPTPGTVVLAVNAGGKQYTDKAGIIYQADKYYSGGRIHRTTKAIGGTGDGPLYQTERFGNFDYAIPVANGNYTVTLKFAELYWSSSGKRIFDVSIEGKWVISNLDIFAKVGKCWAYDVSIPVTVTDGKLNITFRSDGNYAKVNALLVRTR